MSKELIARLRKEYSRRGLLEAEALRDPIEQFRVWFDDAVKAELAEPNAMTLATATNDGAPSARTVLLKDFNADGFVFFTNYASRKGRELESNPRAALHFHWAALERQVRIEGVVEKLSREDSEAYFACRPIESQIGAWVSEQSQTVPDRATLERRFAQVEERYRGRPIPCPPHWGGYRVNPVAIEFWQGRPHRMHDRLLYRREGGSWRMTRLAP